MTKTTSAPADPQGFQFRGLGDLIVRNNEHDGLRHLDAVQRDGPPVMDQSSLTTATTSN